MRSCCKNWRLAGHADAAGFVCPPKERSFGQRTAESAEKVLSILLIFCYNNMYGPAVQDMPPCGLVAQLVRAGGS